LWCSNTSHQRPLEGIAFHSVITFFLLLGNVQQTGVGRATSIGLMRNILKKGRSVGIGQKAEFNEPQNAIVAAKRRLNKPISANLSSRIAASKRLKSVALYA